MSGSLDLLQQIEAARLVGRGGGSFPVARKWQRFLSVSAAHKLIVCNASEGEPDVKKDFFILEKYPEKVLEGMVLAMNFFQTNEAYINFNKGYYQQLRLKIEPLLAVCQEKGFTIHIFEEKPSYIGGETGALLNAIEGKAVQPRITPPSASLQGIFGQPVLLQNVETFYDIALVARGEFQQQRFYTLVGGNNPGVFALPNQFTVAQVLQATHNVPNFAYIVQVGGGASGIVIRSDQATQTPVEGCGLVKIIPAQTEALTLLKDWFSFYNRESCGKCVPCRRGSTQLWEMVKDLTDSSQIPWQEFPKIFRILRKGSLCGLGQNLPNSVETYAKNVLQLDLSLPKPG